MDFGRQFLEGRDHQEPIFAEDSSIVAAAHGLHDLFLSASLECGGVIDSIAEVALVELCHFPSLFLWVFVEYLGGVLPEEVVPVKEPVGVDEEGSHPDGSDSSQPPSIRFDDEVGIVKHLIYNISIIK